MAVPYERPSPDELQAMIDDAVGHEEGELTTALTTKGMDTRGCYTFRRTGSCMKSLSVDTGGHESIELENRRGRKVTVGSNPTPSATNSTKARLRADRVPADADTSATGNGRRWSDLGPEVPLAKR